MRLRCEGASFASEVSFFFSPLSQAQMGGVWCVCEHPGCSNKLKVVYVFFICIAFIYLPYVKV